MEKIVLAGGCFWCTEAVFQRIKGISSVISGYSDDAEAVEIVFDPKIIPLEKLLEIFFHLHDPTTLNQQGNDTGPQYRSEIFYTDESQKETAEKVIEKIAEEKLYENPIVTKVTKFTNFYPAENYHQNYYNSHQNQPYCNFVISPKIAKLNSEFASYLSG